MFIFIGEVFFSDVGDSAYNFLTPTPKVLKNFNAVADSAQKCKMAIFKPKFFGLIPKSPAHTGLVCVKIQETNISSVCPFKAGPHVSLVCGPAPLEKVHSNFINYFLWPCFRIGSRSRIWIRSRVRIQIDLEDRIQIRIGNTYIIPDPQTWVRSKNLFAPDG